MGILAAALWLAGTPALASIPRPLGEYRLFWVKDAAGYRQAEATLRAVGERSYIYVESRLWENPVRAEFVKKLWEDLEVRAPKGALLPDLGIVPLQEKLFAPLPTAPSRDERVSVVIADLARNSAFDGYFSPFDQLPAAQAELAGEHSNEGNIVYVNGPRRSEDFTASVVAEELSRLLTYQPFVRKEPWFEETLGQAAKFASGFFVDQAALDLYAEQSSAAPLVSSAPVQLGSQILFASFLLESMPDKAAGLNLLAANGGSGREAVEALFHQKAKGPATFDVIFSRFLSYLFANAGKELAPPESGSMQIPEIQPYAKITSYPAELYGELMPYSALAIDLPEPLPPTALVQVDTLRPADGQGNCGEFATALWKPVSLKKIAIYSVGCVHRSDRDQVQFHLRVLDKPSLLPSSPLRIGL